MLTLSATVPFLRPPTCSNPSDPEACAPTQFQLAFFFFSVYLTALAQGGHKPCVLAFGADQFDENVPGECESKSSFFNWRSFGICGAVTLNHLMLSYVQDSVGWGLGFGLPGVYTVIALIIFLTGTRTYRYCIISSEGPFGTRLAQVCAEMWNAFKNRFSSNGMDPNTEEEIEAKESLLPEVAHDPSTSRSVEDCQCSSLSEQDNKECKVEPLQELLRLFPIWASCLIYAVGLSQISTLFTKQGSTMDRRIGRTFQVPPAALQSFAGVSALAFVPIYDRVIVPVAKTLTGIPSGVTMLQRIGIGLLLSIVTMAVAALVEMRRLQTARGFGLIDLPKATVPMSFWWLLPQYVLYGLSDTLTVVGLQEFFYDQVPDGLRSLGVALYASVFGVASLISTFLVMVIDKVSSRSGESWFSDDLNRAHLDYFYWLLAGLSSAQLVVYLLFARAFRYKSKGNVAVCVSV